MKRIKLTVAYDGTNYHGFQDQNNGDTIEGELKKALRSLLGKETEVIGASRTDAGVHARCNVAVFDTEARMPADKYAYALNQRLPEDIRIQRSEETAPDFHPRHCHSLKTYEYHILNREFPDPTRTRYAYFTYLPLDVSRMQEAAANLIGTYDFKSFCSVHTQAETTVRTVTSCEVSQAGDEIIIKVQGTGFLYNMVRIIAGTLIEVGAGKREPEQIPLILEAKDRRAAGPTAPACGLMLVQYELLQDTAPIQVEPTKEEEEKMSISYDPMTGEPIETPDEPTNNETPVEETAAQQITGYDPETGEPIYGEASQPTGFDAETGAPIYGNTDGNVPGEETPKKEFPVWILIVAAIVVLVVVLGAVVVKAFGGGTNVKIATAIANTCELSPLMKEMQYADLVKDGAFTMGMGVTVENMDYSYYDELEGMGVDMQLAADTGKGQYGLNGTFKWDAYDLDLGFESYLDKKELALAVPEIADYTFVYNFTEDKDGFLVDMAGDDAVKQIDTLLQWMTSRDNTKQNEKMAADLAKALSANFKTWEFEKGKSQEYEVNGKKHGCKSYTITVTSDMLIDMVESVMDVYDEYFEAQQKETEELLDTLGDDFDIDLSEMDLSDSFKELKHALKDMPDMEVTFYLYKNQVAALIVDDDEDDLTMELLVKGGDYPMQNWEATLEIARDELSITKTGKTKGSVEQNEIEVDGVDATIEWTYDSKSGDLTMDLGADDMKFSVEGNVKKSSNELMLTFDSLKYEDTYYDESMEFSGYMSINSKTSISKPSYKEFDLGNADESDFEDIYDEIQDTLMDLFY